MPVSSKEFLDIEATVECRFTLEFVRDMIITYSHIYWGLNIFVLKLLCTFLNYQWVMKWNWVNYITHQIVIHLIYWTWYSFFLFKCIRNTLAYGTFLVLFPCITFWRCRHLSKVEVAFNYRSCIKLALELKSF